MSLYEYDNAVYGEGLTCFCGVDEAGRGPLAGPVFAAAVILPQEPEIPGLNDSKKLSEKKREALFPLIMEQAVAFGIAAATEKEIDALNILEASKLAMRRAVESLKTLPQLALVDGNADPRLAVSTRLVVKGDATSACIAAASILAKVARDRYMLELDKSYPQYCLAKHKGYPTKLHYEKLVEHGPSTIHRQSFLKKWNRAAQASSNLGAMGEDYAVLALTSLGYEVLERNYRSAYGEIDVIATTEDYICFVEVKTRRQGSQVTGPEAVTRSKQKRIITTALCYLDAFPNSLQPRFDVLSVVTDKKGAIVDCELIPAAFDGGAYTNG
ncbi:ribonuclease HII [Oscillospiraceae bacterium MB08-C2-2]|nr:ribonuclease HII [Oscillospiraceae bacterium MB08-C2-2]